MDPYSPRAKEMALNNLKYLDEVIQRMKDVIKKLESKKKPQPKQESEEEFYRVRELSF